jgi:hypothetical protein
MATFTKRLYEGWKDQAAKEVYKEETGEKPPETKGGIWTKDDILAIENQDIKADILARFDAYVLAAKQSDDARKKSEDTKFKLQNALNAPFVKLGLITKSKEWSILGLDETKNSVVYRDALGKDYKLRHEIRQKRREGRHAINVKFRDADWNEAWDFADKDLEETERDAPADGPPQQNDVAIAVEKLPAEFAGNEKAYVAHYRKLPDMNAKFNFFLDGDDAGSLSDEEQVEFFKSLRKGEQKNLFDLLVDDDDLQGNLATYLKKAIQHGPEHLHD